MAKEIFFDTESRENLKKGVVRYEYAERTQKRAWLCDS